MLGKPLVLPKAKDLGWQDFAVLDDIAGDDLVIGDTHRTIRFVGKQKYALGNLRVVRDCGPLEPPC
jgi:hypothetical protein